MEISRSERREAPYAKARLFDFDEPHVFTLVARKAVEDRGCGLRFRYASGAPRTPVIGALFDERGRPLSAGFCPQNSLRLPAIWQIDSGLALQDCSGADSGVSAGARAGASSLAGASSSGSAGGGLGGSNSVGGSAVGGSAAAGGDSAGAHSVDGGSAGASSGAGGGSAGLSGDSAYTGSSPDPAHCFNCVGPLYCQINAQICELSTGHTGNSAACSAVPARCLPVPTCDYLGASACNQLALGELTITIFTP